MMGWIWGVIKEYPRIVGNSLAVVTIHMENVNEFFFLLLKFRRGRIS